MRHHSLWNRTATLIAVLTLSSAAHGQKHGINFSAGNVDRPPGDYSYLTGKVADTGVRWVYVPIYWAWMEPSEYGTDYWGPRVPRLHSYSYNALDQIVAGFQSQGVTIVFQLRPGQPAWASGSGCDVIAGTSYTCARILTSYKSKFRDNMYDWAYHLAQRYPQIQYWAVGNEPNTDGYFSPQPPLVSGSPAAEFMDLIMTPARDAITGIIPGASVFGPELFTCYDSGDSCTQHDRNWSYDTNWANDWARILLVNWPTYFPRFTIHNYSSSDWGIRTAVGALWDHVMVPTGQTRPIWTTEFNFRSGTCGSTEREIADWTCKNYKYMTWERAFYFDMQDNGCFSLLYNAPGHPPKSFLYPAFTSIVSNTYYCQ